MFSDKPGAAYSVPLSPPSSYAQLALTHSGLVTLTLSNFLDGWCSTSRPDWVFFKTNLYL